MTDKWIPTHDFVEKVSEVQKIRKLWIKEEDDEKDYSFFDDLLCCKFTKEWEVEPFMDKVAELTKNPDVEYSEIWKVFCA
tara:strand:- start:3082 stop:3321 length:240 start_codon:yes stop_codon:yes gene_type:complete